MPGFLPSPHPAPRVVTSLKKSSWFCSKVHCHLRLPFWQLKGNMLILSTCWAALKKKNQPPPKRNKTKKLYKLESKQLRNRVSRERACISVKGASNRQPEGHINGPKPLIVSLNGSSLAFRVFRQLSQWTWRRRRKIMDKKPFTCF